ncbi:MAG: hypothetical protein OXF68_15285 [Gammaproteobacteria bacterium]|nr:hypothetical protein [Gammaproteobacteria bacterium]MCY4342340.1 hypothetical protein [Gammaproteobacteria bacterium]
MSFVISPGLQEKTTPVTVTSSARSHTLLQLAVKSHLPLKTA